MEREKEEDEVEYDTIRHNNMPYRSNKYNFTGSVKSRESTDEYKYWKDGDSRFYAKGVGYGY